MSIISRAKRKRTMTSSNLLNWLLLGVGIAYARMLPHSPGGASRTGGHFCNMKDETTLIAEVHSSYVATIFEGFGGSAASKDPFIVGETPKGFRRGLLKFDMLAEAVFFPPDFQIVCAEIRVSFDKGLMSSGPLQTEVHEVTTPWTINGTTALQGLDGDIARDGDVTWEYAKYPSIKWTNPGGDFVENALSLQHQIPQSNLHSPFEYGWFGYTYLMHSLVTRWIKDSKANHGVLVKSPEIQSSQNAFSVYHGSDANPNLAPKLIVAYTAPSLNYPHKVQHPHGNPNAWLPHHNGGSPSASPVYAGNPGVGDNWNQVGDGYGNNVGSPSANPASSNNGSSDSGRSGGFSSDFEEGLNFDRRSTSDDQYTAAALTITALILVGVVACLLGRRQFSRQTMGGLVPDSSVEDEEPPRSAKGKEIV